MKERKNKKKVVLIDIAANAKYVLFALSVFRSGDSVQKSVPKGGMI